MFRHALRLVCGIIALALAAPEAGAAERIRIGMPTEGFLYVPLYLAIDTGFLREEDIEARLVQFRGGGAAMAGLVSGSVEFCACAIQNAVNANARGAGVTIIGTIIGQYASNLVLRGEVAARLGLSQDSPIERRLSALRGLRIAGSGVGSSTDFLIRYFAREAGLSPERDFTVLFLGDGGPILAAFAQNRIDGFVFSSPTSEIAVARYKGVLVLDMSRGEFPDLRGYPSITLSARSPLLKAKPEVARRILRALARADRLIAREPGRAQAVLRKRFEGVSEDVYAAAWSANVAAYPSTPAIQEESVERAIAFLSAVQGVDIPGPASAYFDAAYADAAIRSLD